MTAKKQERPSPEQQSSPEEDGPQPETGSSADRILVPVFTAVILLLIAAAVAVVMSPDKDATSRPKPATSDLDARPVLPPASRGPEAPAAAPSQPPLARLVPALELELARKDRSLGLWPKGRARDPRPDPYLSGAPVVGSLAQEFGRQIPPDAPPYALALKAITEGRYAEARKILDGLIAAQSQNPVLGAEEEARLYTARGDADYFDLQFADAAESYSTAIEIAPENPYIRYSTARALLRVPPPKEEQRLVIAIQMLLELEANDFTLEKTPIEWGLAKLALGVAFWNFPLGDASVNRDRALESYQASLEAFTKEDFPVEWARTHGFLGELLVGRPEGERADNLIAAMGHFRKATEVITREDFPRQWASLQAKLGSAYADLPTGDMQSNLQAAIECYEQGLSALDPDAQTWERASILMRLGTAYSNLADDKLENLARGNAYFNEALKVITREAYPADWATIQINLANNLISLASQPEARNKDEHIEEAVTILQRALEALGQTGTRFEWASAQYNLATALRLRHAGDRRENLQQAVASFDRALTVFKPEQFPQYHAIVQGARDEAQAELDGLAE
jgi:tetratricopeptide (TPR) repeat protein